MRTYYLLLLVASASARTCGLRKSRNTSVAPSASSTDSPSSRTSTANPSHSTGGSSGKGNATVAAAWFEGWSSTFTPSMVPWDKYTHVTFSFAVTVQDGSLDLSASGGSDELDTFVQAAHKNGVKALASIGGWTGSGYWSDNVATEASRTAFVKTVSNMISKHNLDGIDYDWEYPVVGGETCNNYSPSDTANYLAFAQAMRAANPNIIMSAAAGVTPWKDASGTPSSDVSAFAHALDWVAIMNYDEYGQFTSTAGPNAALNDSCAPAAARQGSAVSAVAAWTAAGMPAGQLVLGVASYGHAFNVSTADALPSGGSKLALFPPFRPWTLAAGETAPTECGAVVAKDVQYTFAGLVQAGFLKADGTAADGIHTIYDDCSQTPFVYNEDTESLVSYDDVKSFAAKGAFIKSSGLRGFAMWEASGDSSNLLLDSIRSAVNN